MQVVTDPQTRQSIINLAQQAARSTSTAAKYRVQVEDVLEEDNWYHIIVTTENDDRDRDFYDALADAEAELQDDQGHQYLLVPGLGD